MMSLQTYCSELVATRPLALRRLCGLHVHGYMSFPRGGAAINVPSIIGHNWGQTPIIRD